MSALVNVACCTNDPSRNCSRRGVRLFVPQMAPKAPPAKGKKGTSPGGRACLLVRTVLTAVPAKSSRVSAPTGPFRTRLVHSPTKRAGRWSLPALGKSSPLNQNLARVSFLENARKRNAPARTATEEDQSSSDSSSDDSEVATDSEDRLHSTLDLTCVACRSIEPADSAQSTHRRFVARRRAR